MDAENLSSEGGYFEDMQQKRVELCLRKEATVSRIGDDGDQILEAYKAKIALQKSEALKAVEEKERKAETVMERLAACIEDVVLPAMTDARRHVSQWGYPCMIEAPFEVHTETKKKRYKSVYFRTSTDADADLSDVRRVTMAPSICISLLTNVEKFDVRFMNIGTPPEYCEIRLDNMTEEAISKQISKSLSRVFG